MHRARVYWWWWWWPRTRRGLRGVVVCVDIRIMRSKFEGDIDTVDVDIVLLPIESTR